MAKANDATDSARIGWAFLSQYYSYLNKDPARLHCFYTKRSTLIHSTEGEDTVACYGQSEIHTKIMSLAFEDCKVYISNVDSQSSAEGGIIVQVIGEMSNSNGPWRKFAQTFFLAEQPNGYFVLNDICRYIKEEGDDEPSSSSPAAPAQESAAASSVEHAVSTNDSAADADAAPASVGSVLFSDSKPAQAEQEKDDSASKAAAPAEPEPSEQPSEPNGKLVNGDVEMKSVEQDATVEVKEEQREPIAVEPLSAVEHKSNKSSAPTVKEETEIPAPVVEEVKKAEKEEVQEAKPTPAVESAPAASEPVSQAAAPAVAQPVASPAPAPAASPAAPAAPKSWASLAASNSTKWGSFNKAAAASTQKPVETTAAPTPPTPAPQPSASSTAPAPQFNEQVQAVGHANCFVKGVLEYVTEKQLREVLTTRFGPIKDLDIIRSKACAFVEFHNLNDARKAIQVSMRHQDGGENGINFETPTGEKARINVVERKPHNERPPPKPRSNQNQNNGGNNVDSTTGGSGAGGGKGGGSKDGQRTQGGRGQGVRNQGQRGSGGGGARTGGGQRQQSSQGAKQ
ncbi:hypothetical protein JCM3766R1_004125 [Sporobolomyces carnicolor]